MGIIRCFYKFIILAEQKQKQKKLNKMLFEAEESLCFLQRLMLEQD